MAAVAAASGQLAMLAACREPQARADLLVVLLSRCSSPEVHSGLLSERPAAAGQLLRLLQSRNATQARAAARLLLALQLPAAAGRQLFSVSRAGADKAAAVELRGIRVASTRLDASCVANAQALARADLAALLACVAARVDSYCDSLRRRRRSAAHRQRRLLALLLLQVCTLLVRCCAAEHGDLCQLAMLPPLDKLHRVPAGEASPLSLSLARALAALLALSGEELTAELPLLSALLECLLEAGWRAEGARSSVGRRHFLFHLHPQLLSACCRSAGAEEERKVAVDCDAGATCLLASALWQAELAAVVRAVVMRSAGSHRARIIHRSPALFLLLLHIVVSGSERWPSEAARAEASEAAGHAAAVLSLFLSQPKQLHWLISLLLTAALPVSIDSAGLPSLALATHSVWPGCSHFAFSRSAHALRALRLLPILHSGAALDDEDDGGGGSGGGSAGGDAVIVCRFGSSEAQTRLQSLLLNVASKCLLLASSGAQTARTLRTQRVLLRALAATACGRAAALTAAAAALVDPECGAAAGIMAATSSPSLQQRAGFALQRAVEGDGCGLQFANLFRAVAWLRRSLPPAEAEERSGDSEAVLLSLAWRQLSQLEAMHSLAELSAFAAEVAHLCHLPQLKADELAALQSLADRLRPVPRAPHAPPAKGKRAPPRKLRLKARPPVQRRAATPSASASRLRRGRAKLLALEARRPSSSPPRRRPATAARRRKRPPPRLPGL
eukprot:PLAT6433.22.p1 GENE.PLAT6433.22~~PLAT6433.22.p1  ORF type:complete len:731 (+),score=296.97 PLAT6433.22:65-2257(+)